MSVGFALHSDASNGKLPEVIGPPTVTQIDLTTVRIDRACLDRWCWRSVGDVRVSDDGTIGKPAAEAYILEDDVLGVVCQLSATFAVFLKARPGEWRRKAPMSASAKSTSRPSPLPAVV
jgi:hypothetical protein